MRTKDFFLRFLKCSKIVRQPLESVKIILVKLFSELNYRTLQMVNFHSNSMRAAKLVSKHLSSHPQ